MIQFVLLVFLSNSSQYRSPVALPATSRDHCESLADKVKSLKYYSGATCLQLSTYVEALKQLPTKEQ